MSSSLPVRPPRRTVETAPFWDACAEHRLVLPRCDQCAHFIWYPRLLCPACGSTEVSWSEVSGRGTIYSFTVIRRGEGAYRSVGPYVLAHVELAEGPRLMTNIVDGDLGALRVGLPVHAVFDDAGDGDALPRFTPS